MGEKMSDDDIKNMIKEADEDGDGKVSFEEFKKLMQR
jgi:Ca2+-binding EF-hand superfamily protein